jgi:hypothetical protein
METPRKMSANVQEFTPSFKIRPDVSGNVEPKCLKIDNEMVKSNTDMYWDIWYEKQSKVKWGDLTED